MTGADALTLYVLAGLGCAVAILRRARFAGGAALASALVAVPLWPLWAPFALRARTARATRRRRRRRRADS